MAVNQKRFHCSLFTSLEEAIQFCTGGRDTGMIRYFEDTGTDYLELKDFGPNNSRWSYYQKPTKRMIIASKAIGRRSPEIILPFT